MNFVMRKQWTEGNEEPTSALPEARTARGHTALWLERWRGEERGGSATGAAHAGPQRHKQRYDGIWGGPSVTTNGRKSPEWESIS